MLNGGGGRLRAEARPKSIRENYLNINNSQNENIQRGNKRCSLIISILNQIKILWDKRKTKN